MENLKKAIIVSSIFVAVQINAGELENILGSSGNSVGISKMQYISTQSRGYATFGGASIKSNLGGTIRPFTLETPSFHSGCGGVDVNLGGMSFLSMEQLGEKLKTIMSSAPTFVFQMALSVLCKDCQSILNQIDAIAETINGLNFDACKAAVNYGKAAGDVISNYMAGSDNTYEGVQKNMENSNFLSRMTQSVQDYGNTVQSYLDGTVISTNTQAQEAAKAKIYGGVGSFIKFALEEKDKTNSNSSAYTDTFKRYFGKLFANPSKVNNANIESFIRGFVGDVYGYTDKDCGGAKNTVTDGTLPTFQVILPSMSADEFINFIYGNGEVNSKKNVVKGLSITENTNGCGGLKGKPKLSKVEIKLNTKSDSFRKLLVSELKAIRDKLSKKSKNLENELNKINVSKYPVYTALNISSFTKDDSLVEYTADYILSNDLLFAIRELTSQIREILSSGTTSEAGGQIKSENKVRFEAMVKRLQNIEAAMKKRRDESAKEMVTRAANVDYLDNQMKKIVKEYMSKGLNFGY